MRALTIAAISVWAIASLVAGCRERVELAELTAATTSQDFHLVSEDGEGRAGAYLISLVAQAAGDTRLASQAMMEALKADPENIDILYDAYVLLVMGGDVGKAAALARRKIAVRNDAVMASVIVAVDDASRGDYKAAHKVLAAAPITEKTGSLIVPLLKTWAAVGTGAAPKKAVEELAPLSRDKQNAGLYKLAEASVLAGESAQVGFTESLWLFAASNYKNGKMETAEIFSRLALHIDPKFVEGLSLLAGIMEAKERYGEAGDLYAQVPSGHSAKAAMMRKAAIDYGRIGQEDKALKILRDLAAKNSKSPELQLDIGDMLRKKKQYQGAISAYTAAIEGFGTDSKAWGGYFGRAIAYDGAGQWPKAEADLKKALEILPQNYITLNYLGYVWADRGENLEAAGKMLAAALKLSPENGEIIDSLGWLELKRGREADAVALLERAVQFLPASAVVNYHLGEAYYASGRKLEARYQFDKALTLPAAETDLKPAERARIEALNLGR
ncbi:hypothetical protein FACS1894186_2480 [Alphaproteobacteria bacterium]|nr:hypothetical protein FACS1894186_2480 [Alphaproteobacteria bacterium]